MAHEQIEYCGNCEHFAECLEKSANGQFTSCKVNEENA